MKKGWKIWIPSAEKELKLKLMVIAHCVTSGHRGVDGTLSTLLSEFYWKGMRESVEHLIKGCAHCLISRTGINIHYPLGQAPHGSEPNAEIYIDFLFMRNIIEVKIYCLIVKYDLSYYV